MYPRLVRFCLPVLLAVLAVAPAFAEDPKPPGPPMSVGEMIAGGICGYLSGALFGVFNSIIPILAAVVGAGLAYKVVRKFVG